MDVGVEVAEAEAAEVEVVVEGDELTVIETGPLPRHLLLQWHVTERCNLRCAHCYQTDYQAEDMAWEDMTQVLDQFRDLLRSLTRRSGAPTHGHINITGGEPLLCRDLFALIAELKKDGPAISCGLLTNGTLIDRPTAQRIRSEGVSFVQVSVDGGRKAHDAIRGAGNYDRAVRGLERLKEVGQPTMLSFTANRSNFMDFGKVVSLGRRVGAIKVWSDRMVPCGSGANMKDGTFTPEHTYELVSYMRRIKRSDRYHPWSGTETAMDRSLQFLAGGRPYACTAGRSLLTVMPNGDVYPCRRLPIKVGNVKQHALEAIYLGDGMLRRLRDPSIVALGCEDCQHHPVCKGGSRCLAYAMTGDPFRADPGCWISRPLSNEPHRAVAGAPAHIK